VPELRPVRDDDIARVIDVFWATLDDLAARSGRPPAPRNPVALEGLVRHIAATDPASSIVADDHGRVVAFGMLHARGSDGFLAFLFVLPAWQGRGIGRAILDACRDGAGRPPRLGTCAEADQPVSTGLYAAQGLAPRTPLYLLRGALSPASLPDLPVGLRPRRLVERDVVALDDALLGYQRSADHAFFATSGRLGWAVDDDRGEVVAYGYVQPSGRLGPVGVADPNLLGGLIGHLARSIVIADGWQVVVPGVSRALPLLLAQGLRIDATPAVYCADHEGPAFERYLPTSFALL
jgi:GNAT superfamily N-acetyltransferase